MEHSRGGFAFPSPGTTPVKPNVRTLEYKVVLDTTEARAFIDELRAANVNIMAKFEELEKRLKTLEDDKKAESW